MPIPLMYQQNSKSSFSHPRIPPVVPRYDPPRFEKLDRSPSIGNGYSLYLSHPVRNHMIAMLGEFIGTLFFLFFGLAAGQIANGKSDTINRTGPLTAPSLLQLLFISSGFGVGLAVNVWIFFRVSGGQFNPAVTFALCLVGAVPWIRGALLIPVQLAAGIAASGIVVGIFPGGTLTVATTLGADTTYWQGLLIEMMLTAQLILTILMLAVEKHRATFLAPLGIGLALFAGHLLGISTTGAGINPARAFGPSVVLGKFVGYHWIYWLGPFLGALLAVAIHKVLKFLQYQTANWGQDDDGLDVYRIVSRARRGSNESTGSLAHLI